MTNKVLLLYGSGPNVGAGILKKFAVIGWKTAAVVRTLRDEYKNSGDVVLQADFADTQAIQKVYSQVESKLGTPNCIVYNGLHNPCTESRRALFRRSANPPQDIHLNHSAQAPQDPSLLHPKKSQKTLTSIR